MSFWHWLVLLMLVAVPFFLIYVAVRAGVRSGMRDRQAASPPDAPPPDGGN